MPKLNSVNTPGWRTSMIVHGFDLTRLVELGATAVPTVPVVSGLIETSAGGLQFAMRIGENGQPAILPLQAASQHIVHVREVLIERLRQAGEQL